MANTVTEKDLGWSKITKSLSNIPYDITIGIQGKEAGQDHQGLTNAMLGSIHEYGTENIPQRSFLRFTLNKNEKKYIKEVVTALKHAAEGRSLEGEFKIVGEIVRADVIKTIKDGIPPALASGTIAQKKGETTPLIDTGQLWNSISYLLRKR